MFIDRNSGTLPQFYTAAVSPFVDVLARSLCCRRIAPPCKMTVLANRRLLVHRP